MSFKVEYHQVGRDPMTLGELISILEEAQKLCGSDALILFEWVEKQQVRLIVAEPSPDREPSPIRLKREIDVGGVRPRRVEVIAR